LFNSGFGWLDGQIGLSKMPWVGQTTGLPDKSSLRKVMDWADLFEKLFGTKVGDADKYDSESSPKQQIRQ
jgi:hypothetical protein